MVDDNPTARRILGEFFEQWGARIVLLPGANEALDALQSAAAKAEPFSLVLIDSAMPDLGGFSLARYIVDNPACAREAVLMLRPASQIEGSAWCRDHGIRAAVTKPLRRSELLKTITRPAGSSTPAIHGGRPDGQAEMRPSRSLRVLLAEDNPVNQRLAVRILEKWGHQVIVAANGKKAIEAHEREMFDVILMDVQMPQMSGLEAVEIIRAREQQGGRRTPVIAMTAHAMDGDRAKCLNAGMDDYVSKPIDRTKLFAAIERFFQEAADPSADPEARALSVPDRFDREMVLQRVDGDIALLKEVAGLFFQDAPRLLAEMRQAVTTQDAQTLERAAHTLKGCIGNFGAPTAQELSGELEAKGRTGEFHGATEIIQRLEQQLAELRPALENLVKEAA